MSSRLRLAVAVVFLDEEALLPRLLASIERQDRLPDRLLLVDDGSSDRSPEIARAFALAHPYAQVLRRPRRERATDRLAAAAELRAFKWAVDQLHGDGDVIAKLDGDLELTPPFFATVARALDADPRLGIAGTGLRVPGPDGRAAQERSMAWHVRGATKFYRRACWEQIAPLPEVLGWDTIDEARARLRGWDVRNVAVPGGDALHLRPTGTYDGALRGFRRKGMAAWAYGAHPAWVAGSALVRMRERPRVVGGLAYAGGWLEAARVGAPRAEPEVRQLVRGEQRRRLSLRQRGRRA